jgi:hypothetical protein
MNDVLKDILKSKSCYHVSCSMCPIAEQCYYVLARICGRWATKDRLFQSKTTCTFTGEVFEQLIKKLLEDGIIEQSEVFEVLL